MNNPDETPKNTTDFMGSPRHSVFNAPKDPLHPRYVGRFIDQAEGELGIDQSDNVELNLQAKAAISEMVEDLHKYVEWQREGGAQTTLAVYEKVQQHFAHNNADLFFKHGFTAGAREVIPNVAALANFEGKLQVQVMNEYNEANWNNIQLLLALEAVAIMVQSQKRAALQEKTPFDMDQALKKLRLPNGKHIAELFLIAIQHAFANQG